MAAPLFYNQGDQELYKQFQYLPQEQFRLGLNLPKNTEAEAVNTTFGIPATNAFTGTGNKNYFTGSTDQLINNFNAANQKGYFNSLPTPNVDSLDQSMRDKTFMGMRSYNENQDVNPVDAGEYLAANQDIPTRFDPTMAGRVQETLDKSKDLIGKGIAAFGGFGPVSFIANKLDRFDTLPAMDREYINQSKYYTGPTVFGANNSGLGKDIFGINTRSMFGNYGAFVDKTAEELEEKNKQKALKGLQLKRLNFYRAEKEKRARDLKIAQSEAAAANDKAQNQNFQQAMAQGRGFYDQFGKGGQEASQTREEAGSGFSDVSESGPFADGGRVSYMIGGLASIL